ncbi:helix-turn-helix domain-containing protein [Burkholderia pseudomallei]|uniref:helix-turn-helix domain-containing protein n=1 Tax=Burkholderia pseudomallei TaxID=28450 RepID=UPI00168AD419|nr:helix-turn-helix transcriptional regulator [Burkholderia pseudomallei]MBD2956682.1 helix-turn-helix transcriptional regulator [Burkholderia pseudomallei]MBD2974895.1 helix-turn-helix transcriptional regulator [Burkholderia pseudomallei]MBF3693466.1 helix-turn-helix transcriptional regulator [Burkholderia pseudomallei]
MNKKDIDPWLRGLLARNLRRIRLEKSVTQEDLSEHCGFHRTYVSQVERSMANVSIDNLQRLAEALKVSPIALLEPGKPDGD